MKTPIYFLALLLLTAPVFGNTSKLPALREEMEVQDIPFSTELIFMNYLLSAFNFDEEQYVDDIPFNTESIAFEARFNQMVKANEESYIADIPFDTEVITNNFKADHAFADYYEEPQTNDVIIVTVYDKNCSKRYSYAHFTKRIPRVNILKANSLQIKNLQYKYPAYLEFAKPIVRDAEIISTAE